MIVKYYFAAIFVIFNRLSIIRATTRFENEYKVETHFKQSSGFHETLQGEWALPLHQIFYLIERKVMPSVLANFGERLISLKIHQLKLAYAKTCITKHNFHFFPVFPCALCHPCNGIFYFCSYCFSLAPKKKPASTDEWHLKWKITSCTVHLETPFFQLDSFDSFHHINQSYINNYYYYAI